MILAISPVNTVMIVDWTHQFFLHKALNWAKKEPII
jgi:hypothetical protein